MFTLNPPIRDRLRNASTRLLGKGHWYITTWPRAAADDAVYVTVALLILLGVYRLGYLIDDSLRLSIVDRVRAAGSGLGDWLIATLMCGVILTVTLRIAPRHGVVRWVAMILGAAFAAFTVHGYFVTVVGVHPTFDDVPIDTLELVLVATACFFHNTAHNVEGELFRTQLHNAGLEAQFTRAQLELLQVQIEPHFLFNTLATVCALARVDPQAAAAMLDNLLRYFAAALPRLRQSDSSLAEELDLVDAYLWIQKLRMGARLSYQLSVPETLLTARVPSMMLLTLVENAIKHGISPATAGGMIRVSADQRDSMLTLSVTDTGQGMRAQHGYGSGLANARARLTLLYPHRATLALVPGEPRGVVATIQIPMENAA